MTHLRNDNCLTQMVHLPNPFVNKKYKLLNCLVDKKLQYQTITLKVPKFTSKKVNEIIK